MAKKKLPSAEPMSIEMRPVESIHEYDKNARVIPQSGVELVAKSIKQFGFRQPIVVDKDGAIIVGHTRHRAAMFLGLTEVPVHVMDASPEQVRAYRLMDNRSNQESTWDQDILREELGELAGLLGDDKDMLSSLTGFGTSELDAFIGSLSVTASGLEPAPKEERDDTRDRIPDDSDKCKCPKCGFAFAPQVTTASIKRAKRLFGEADD